MANRRPGWSVIPGDWVQLNRVINELGWSVLKTTTPLWDLVSGNTSLHSGSLVLSGLSGVLKATVGVVGGSASTTDVPEGTNLYYTDTRARAAISETVVGLDYNNTSGVLSLTTGYVIPTTTEETNWNSAYGSSHVAITLAATADVLLGLTGQQLSLDTQTATYVLSGPTTGVAAAPTFRALVATDIPALAYEASGSIASHAALTTGVHGLNITAGKTITVSDNATINQDCSTAGSPAFAGLTVDTSTLCIDATSNTVLLRATTVQSGTGPGGALDADGDIKLYRTEVATVDEQMKSSHVLYFFASRWNGSSGTNANMGLRATYADATAGGLAWQFLNNVGSPLATLLVGGNFGFGTVTPAEKVHSSAKIRADTAFNLNGTDGLASQVVALAKLTTLGSDGSITISGGIVTAYTAPT